VTNEFERRQTNTEKVYALFRAKPGQWIGPHELAHVGGFSAWRTRVSEARALAAKQDCEILWNGKNSSETAYMLRPCRLGRDASERIEQKSLFG